MNVKPSPAVLKKIGKNFRAIRNSMGATQKEFAHGLQINAPLLARIEEGHVNWVNLKPLFPLWERLGYKMTELMK